MGPSPGCFGLEAVLRGASSMDGATERKHSEGGLEHSDCLFGAVGEVLGMMCGLEARPEARLEGAEPPDAPTVVGVISLVGDVQWSVSIGLPEGTASALAERFAGFAIPFESEEMGDAVGEMANIIAGTTKAKLDERGLKAEISLPNVVRGERMRVLNFRTLPAERRRFTCECGEFWVEVVARDGEGS